jgi:hypothetical protein
MGAAAVIGFAVSLSAQTTVEPPDTFKVSYFGYVQPGLGPNGTPDGTPDQQLSECCGCNITPDGLLTLSIDQDLISNPLTPVFLQNGALEIVSSTLACEANNFPPSAGIRAWATHIQNDASVTETEFTDSKLSAGELKLLENKCSAI